MARRRRRVSVKKEVKPRKTSVIKFAKETEVFEEVKYLFTKDNPMEWIVLREVCTDLRRTDMVLINCWRSRGYEIVGVEIKTARADWLRELKSPEKSEHSFFKYCDRWYVAGGDKSLIKPEEVPINWGLILPARTRMQIVKPAPQLQPETLDKGQWVSLLRRAYQRGGIDKEAELQDPKKKVDEGEPYRQEDILQMREQLERLQKIVLDFEESSGVNLASYSLLGKGKELGTVLKSLLDGQGEKTVLQLSRAWSIVKNEKDRLEELIAQIEDYQGKESK